MLKADLICHELLIYINMPYSDLEPANCEVNKLRAMSSEERETELLKMTFAEQLKLARTHKVCTEVLNKQCCLLSK